MQKAHTQQQAHVNWTCGQREREREFIFLCHRKSDYKYSSNNTVTQCNDLCTMAGSTENPLGYRVRMLPDTNAANSEIKKENREKIRVSGNTKRCK